MQCQGARYRDAEHCERELDCFGLKRLTDAAARGVVDYDPSKVGECHQRFLRAPCEFGFFLFTPDIYEVLQYCPGTVTPRAKAGDSCSSSGECSEGLYCYKGVDYQCPGRCQAFSEVGQDCAGSGRCAEGLTCRDDVCAPPAQAGDDCTIESCNYSVSCPSGEICPENIWCDETLGQCQPGRMVGEPCGTLGTPPDTSYANCAIPLWCDAVAFSSGICRARSGLNEPCNGETYACERELHCVGYAADAAAPTLGTCQGPGPAGTECTADEDCQAGLACTLGTCRELGSAGATCDGSPDCALGLVCSDGLCVAARYPGDACDGTRCTFGRCVEGTCQFHAKVGEPCANPSDCATGECIDGVCYDDSVCNAPEP
jgi:hypothetical protein